MFQRSALALLLAAAAAAPLSAQTAAELKPLPRAQMIANAEDAFAKVDANKDGQMTRAEIETFQASSFAAQAAARNAAVFAALDSDKNGQISPAEFAKLNAAAPKPDATRVLRNDTNNDGKVSLAEHRAAALATFDKLDVNKDGAVSVAEMKAGASVETAPKGR